MKKQRLKIYQNKWGSLRVVEFKRDYMKVEYGSDLTLYRAPLYWFKHMNWTFVGYL